MCKKKDYCYFCEIHMNTLEKLDKNDLLKKKNDLLKIIVVELSMGEILINN